MFSRWRGFKNSSAAMLHAVRRARGSLASRAAPRRQQPVAAGAARAAPYASSASDDEASALAFIVERGYEPRLASAVIATLKDPSGWGARDGELLKTAEQLAGAWEIGADAGLGALAAAVEREMAETAGKAPVSVVIYPASGERPFTVSALEGQTLRDVCESGVDGGAQPLRGRGQRVADGGASAAGVALWV